MKSMKLPRKSLQAHMDLVTQEAIAEVERKREEILQNRQENSKTAKSLKITGLKGGRKFTNGVVLTTQEYRGSGENNVMKTEVKLISLSKNNHNRGRKGGRKDQGQAALKQERENEDVPTRLLREQGLQDCRRWHCGSTKCCAPAFSRS